MDFVQMSQIKDTEVKRLSWIFCVSPMWLREITSESRRQKNYTRRCDDVLPWWLRCQRICLWDTLWEYQVWYLDWEVLFLAITLSIISSFIKTTFKVGSIFLVLVSHLKAVMSRKSKQMTPSVNIRVLIFHLIVSACHLSEGLYDLLIPEPQIH